MYTAWDLFKELWRKEEFRDAWREDEFSNETFIESAFRLAEEKVTDDNLSKVESELSRIIFYKEDGKCPVKDFILSIGNEKLQQKILKDMSNLDNQGRFAREPLSSYVGEGIYEMRTIQGSNFTRIFYFFVIGDLMIMTNGYEKHSQKMDKSEFKLAKKRREKYSQMYEDYKNKRD